jgi:RND family efflux transporter MFP subunit
VQAEQAVQAAISTRDALRLEGAGQASRRVLAPYDGVIASVAAAPGVALAPGGVLLTIVRGDALVATIGLDARQAATVHAGDPVALMAFDRATRAVDGRVLAIGAMVNPQSGLVDATVAMPAAGFLIGQSVAAEIGIGTARGVIVPRDAALPDGRRFRIWQVGNGHARPVDVRIVARTASSAVVRGPIDPSLPIVASGNYQLTPGIAVRVVH